MNGKTLLIQKKYAGNHFSKDVTHPSIIIHQGIGLNYQNFYQKNTYLITFFENQTCSAEHVKPIFSNKRCIAIFLLEVPILPE